MRTALCILCLGSVALGQEMTGTPVSRPLTEVVELPKVEPPPVVESPPAVEEVKQVKCGLLQSWSSYELLLWWSKSQPLPPLVTGSVGASPPVLGGPDTRLLVGGRSLGDAFAAGFRFNMGWSVYKESGESVLGFEFGGLFLGTDTQSITYSDAAGFAQIGRPFIDSRTGAAGVLPVSGVGIGTGGVLVGTTTRTQGWEVNLVRNLVDCGETRVTAIGGYRYLGVNEGLHIQQTSLRIPPGQAATVMWNLFDQFDARNNFHGGQIGLKVDGALGRWMLSLSGTIALGSNFETVQIRGGSSASTPALPMPAVQQFRGGLLTSASNIGRTTQAELAYVPEGRLNLGYQISDSCHFFLGYDFLYLSDAIRPGDQVDQVIDPSRVPVANAGAAFGATRPTVPFARSDFWVQGLTLGFDYRY